MRRALTDREVAVIREVVRHGPDSEPLLAQLSRACVTDELGADIRLSVPASTKRSHVPDGPLPVRAWVMHEADGWGGEILVWMRSGYLHSVEFAWWTDVPPEMLPPVELIDFPDG